MLWPACTSSHSDYGPGAEVVPQDRLNKPATAAGPVHYEHHQDDVSEMPLYNQDRLDVQKATVRFKTSVQMQSRITKVHTSAYQAANTS